MEIGDKVRILTYGSGMGYTKYIKAIIIKIHNHHSYNMYECKSKYGYKLCFTDIDLNMKLKNPLVKKGWVDEEKNEL